MARARQQIPQDADGRHIGIQQGKDGDKSEMRFYNGFTSAGRITNVGVENLAGQSLAPVRSTPGVTKLVSFGHQLARMSPERLQAVRAGLSLEATCAPSRGKGWTDGWSG